MLSHTVHNPAGRKDNLADLMDIPVGLELRIQDMGQVLQDILVEHTLAEDKAMVHRSQQVEVGKQTAVDSMDWRADILRALDSQAEHMVPAWSTNNETIVLHHHQGLVDDLVQIPSLRTAGLFVYCAW